MTPLGERIPRLRTLIDTSTHEALTRAFQLSQVSNHTQDLQDAAYAQVASGKRFRGILAMLGAEYIRPHSTATVSLAAGLELYQASALAHDDLIDHAATRRANPTPHIRFRDIHIQNTWSGNAADFGAAAAILLGDFLFSAAEIALSDQCALLAEQTAQRLMQRYAMMHAQVAIGQYLDIRAEHLPLDPQVSDAIVLSDILQVARYKSALYSVVHPFILGAISAEATEELITQLEHILLPWGLAFQLRDDDLGVFGDPCRTGKPSGDDLREGKRTALLALTWHKASYSERKLLCTVLGNADADDDALAQAAHIIDIHGRKPHEALITQLVDEGHAHMASLPHERNEDILSGIAQILTERSA
ncbi:polyprenyl synthetase family protein [Schaalia sp. lx-100]|uniref:polyprenyl synthetase family protein n=1 Tax=Schaalia sp. lx-100 TaxID=2899081 RepID=UPI001E2FF058|nr:polyprenyl synthetase family protein [Schaalia sp. lx-100]MCD4558055.1 polyprenyl synthetase family protein [Schaalia sp. lx-100]